MKKLFAWLLSLSLLLTALPALAEENPVTWNSYDEVIALLDAAYWEGWGMDAFIDAGFETDIFMNFSDLYPTMGYALLDLNGDGADELLIGSVATWYMTETGEFAPLNEANDLYLVFTTAGGSVQLVAESWVRAGIGLRADGTLCRIGSNSAFEQSYEVWALQEEGMVCTLTISEIWQEDGSVVYAMYSAFPETPMGEEEAAESIAAICETIFVPYTPLQNWFESALPGELG